MWVMKVIIYTSINLATILAVMWLTNLLVPHWSAERIMLWSLIIFVASWRATTDADQ